MNFNFRLCFATVASSCTGEIICILQYHAQQSGKNSVYTGRLLNFEKNDLFFLRKRVSQVCGLIKRDL